MTILAQEPWTWTVYADGDRRILSVFTGGVAMWELSIDLTTEERGRWDAGGIAELMPLVKGIQQTPEKYRARQVPDPQQGGR